MRRVIPLAVLLVALAGCGGGGKTAGTNAAAKPATLKTVWLCFPGRSPDPCVMNLAETDLGPGGSKRLVHPRTAANPPIDCFYVYPTVSQENRGNADRAIGLEQILVAQTQAAQFSRVCRVYAPVYRQITDRGLTTPSLHAKPLLAYADILAAWRNYLAHSNHGRGVVLIAHSQGAYVLKHLLATVIARSPAQRRLLVSAVLLGGQVHIPDRAGAPSDTGGIPVCAAPAATGCVIAYSTFDRVPPKTAMFGRSRIAGTSIACVNPARPGSTGAEPVTPLVPAVLARFAGVAQSTPVSTPWVAYPDLYTARCAHSGNASWLEVTRIPPPSDPRPVLKATLGPGWGLHLVDVNVALSNLVGVVQAESRAFARRNP